MNPYSYLQEQRQLLWAYLEKTTQLSELAAVSDQPGQVLAQYLTFCAENTLKMIEVSERLQAHLDGHTTIGTSSAPADLPGDGLEFPPVDPSDIPPADGTDQLELELAVRESLGLSAEQWAALEEVERGQRIAQFRPAS